MPKWTGNGGRDCRLQFPQSKRLFHNEGVWQTFAYLRTARRYEDYGNFLVRTYLQDGIRARSPNYSVIGNYQIRTPPIRCLDCQLHARRDFTGHIPKIVKSIFH